MRSGEGDVRATGGWGRNGSECPRSSILDTKGYNGPWRATIWGIGRASAPGTRDRKAG